MDAWQGPRFEKRGVAMAPIKVGDAIPSVVVFEGEPEKKVNLAELFKGKKGVLFGVPGAFTPGCSKTHLPGFVEQAEALKAKGIQVVACLSVNDVFVTEMWGRAHNTEGKVRLLADPTGAFGKETDLLLDDSLVSLFGNRSLDNVHSYRHWPQVSHSSLPSPTGLLNPLEQPSGDGQVAALGCVSFKALWSWLISSQRRPNKTSLSSSVRTSLSLVLTQWAEEGRQPGNYTHENVQ